MVLSRVLRVFLFVMASMIAAVGQAQPFPSKPIKIVVGFSPGGGADIVARGYAAQLQEVLNTPVIVDNRPGASELIAAQAVMAAPPDGYTLWVQVNALTLAPAVRNDLPYDPLKSFTYISRLAGVDALLSVRKGLPVSSIEELISYAKANPGKLSYGSGGVGIANHVVVEYIAQLTGIQMTHVPYKGEVDMVRDLIGGGIDFGLVVGAVALPFAADGRIKPIAITGSERLSSLPSVAPLGESSVKELKALGDYATFGLVGPAGMPPAVVQKINEAVNKVARMPDVAQRFEKLQIKPKAGSAAEFRQQSEAELMRWRSVTKNLKL
ncbi:tripartite tricarboxylate transporter substrate binding protein [Variovorax paradoxus]|nr:tripartite tricarboxylate transporter substrate binding protein [Variovorax paradoxus]